MRVLDELGFSPDEFEKLVDRYEDDDVIVAMANERSAIAQVGAGAREKTQCSLEGKC